MAFKGKIKAVINFKASLRLLFNRITKKVIGKNNESLNRNLINNLMGILSN